MKIVTVPPPGSSTPAPDTGPELELDIQFGEGPAQPRPTPPRKSLRLNTLIVMAGTLGSRLSGIVRQMIINRFGNTVGDAFNIAVGVPNLLRELLAEGALINSFIPIYKSLDETERRRLASAFSGVLIAVNLLIMAIGIFAAPLVVSVLTSANANIDRDLAVYMTRLVMPFLMLISLSTVAMGLLNADEHFRESSFAPIAFNIASIIALLLLPHNATWLAFGWLVGGVAQLAVQLPALRRFGLLPSPELVRHPALGRVLRQMAPFTLTAGARQFLNVFVKRQLTDAQLFQAGTVFGYSNAESLFTMAYGLFVVSPALALFPRFSQHAADRDWGAFNRLTVQAIRTSTFLAAPMSALLVALAPYAVSLFNVSSRSFDAARFQAGSGILTGWALALVPWALVNILQRTFYARERTREAVTASAIGFVAEVGLYKLLVPKLGLLGFGISTTLSGLLLFAALAVMYRRALGFPGREIGGHLLRVVPLAAVAGLAAFVVSKIPFMPQPGVLLPGLIGLALCGGVGLAVYLLGALLLRMPEMGGLLRRLRR